MKFIIKKTIIPKAAIESGKTNYLHDVEYAAMQAMKEDAKKAISVFVNCNQSKRIGKIVYPFFFSIYCKT